MFNNVRSLGKCSFSLLAAPLILILACAFFLGGCSTQCLLTNPFQSYPTRPDRTKYSSDYPSAVKYAQDTQDDYRNFLICKADRYRLLGSTIIAAGGAALALGSEGLSSASVTGLTVGGGTLLGLGLWNNVTAQNDAYSQGIEDIQCVLDKEAPLSRVTTAALDEKITPLRSDLPNITDEDIANLKSSCVDLDDAAKAVKAGDGSAAQKVTVLNAGRPEDAAAAATQGQQVADDASQTKKDANTAIAAANGIKASLESSGSDIVSAVSEIDAKAFTVAYKGEPSLTSLKGNGIQSYITPIQTSASSSQSAAPSPGALGVPSPCVVKAKALATKVLPVKNETQALSGLIAGVEIPSGDLSSCYSNLSSSGAGQGPLQVSQSNLYMGKGDTTTLVVQGGQTPYTITKDTGIDVTQSQGNGYLTLQVTSDDGKDHTITVADKSSSTQKITIKAK